MRPRRRSTPLAPSTSLEATPSTIAASASPTTAPGIGSTASSSSTTSAPTSSNTTSSTTTSSTALSAPTTVPTSAGVPATTAPATIHDRTFRAALDDDHADQYVDHGADHGDQHVEHGRRSRRERHADPRVGRTDDLRRRARSRFRSRGRSGGDEDRFLDLDHDVDVDLDHDPTTSTSVAPSTVAPTTTSKPRTDADRTIRRRPATTATAPPNLAFVAPAAVPGAGPDVDPSVGAGRSDPVAGPVGTERRAAVAGTRALTSATGGSRSRAAAPAGVTAAHPSPVGGTAIVRGIRVEGVRIVAAEGDGARDVQLSVRDTRAETPVGGPLLVAPASRLSGAALVSVLVAALAILSITAAQVGRSLRNPTSHPPFLPRPSPPWPAARSAPPPRRGHRSADG